MRFDRPPHTCVYGLGWGDEGKGKVVDLLCPAFDAVVRFNGGANAGHTVCVGGETFALHLLPSGVLHDDVLAVIGPGVVVDPVLLLEEIDALALRGIHVADRLRISDRAHLVLAHHKLEDQLSERAAGTTGRIGTTARGIGPCYADMMRRTSGLRFSDLLHANDLPERVRTIVAARKRSFQAAYGDDGGLDAEPIIADLAIARTRLGPFVCDTTDLLHRAMGEGQAVLFEGANGLLLDVQHGTYPYVTSSNTGPHGIGGGAGVLPSRVSSRIGVTKAYATRVGLGPFVTELEDSTGEQIRARGHEYGTTTGRARRCGWFDAVACRYSAVIGDATDIALTHLDTLCGFPEIGICVAYRCDGVTLTTPPADAGMLGRTEPVIEFLPGWSEDLRAARSFEDLPVNTRAYIERIESLLGISVSLVGVGPDRSEALVRRNLKKIVNAEKLASP